MLPRGDTRAFAQNRFTSGFTAIMQLPSMPCPTFRKTSGRNFLSFSVGDGKNFDRQVSLDGTRKYVMTLADGSLVETVGMPVYHRDGSLDRLSVCVSSQVGCPMACQFCATGREGLTRNLTAAEIISQVALVQEDFQERVSNVVVMGQGSLSLTTMKFLLRCASKQQGRFQYRSKTHHALYLRHYRWDRLSLPRARTIHARRVSSFGSTGEA